MADKQGRETAQQTFRQFAWNLAGTLADKGRPGTKPGIRPQSRVGTKR
ncbi:hypothetical protein SAMN05216456_2266 [Devosia crocina]|uniref:Uncharacterized protein n=1 Tax=Devosia crocina TaxID=429728 RepID=A0A1I7NMJ9_9HYPH|nr:hypothetical protein SAMN05216456_2266 [Devosia crocina]